MPFQIEALAKLQFTPERTRDAIRTIATKKPGFPCRVSLADAEVGEEVLLLHYEHHSAASPFRSSHAIYIRPLAAEARLAPNAIPQMFLTRTLSLRAFDANGMMLDADLVEGPFSATAIDRLFEDPSVSYIHIHFARPGCYAARAIRAVE